MPSPAQLGAIRLALLALCVAPALWFFAAAWTDHLGANPVEAVTRGLGDWALRLLLLTLCITPLRRWLAWPWLLKLRRMLGVTAFVYALLHLAAYVWADQFFDWDAIFDDILHRPFITVGFLTFVLLVPLAATSTNAMIRRLGGRRWQKLHRLAYPAAILAVLHFFWMVKLDIREPLVYAAALAGLLGVRLYWRQQARGAVRTSCGGRCSPP